MAVGCNGLRILVQGSMIGVSSKGVDVLYLVCMGQVSGLRDLVIKFRVKGLEFRV